VIAHYLQAHPLQRCPCYSRASGDFIQLHRESNILCSSPSQENNRESIYSIVHAVPRKMRKRSEDKDKDKDKNSEAH
jgi:hypothetical protein